MNAFIHNFFKRCNYFHNSLEKTQKNLLVCQDFLLLKLFYFYCTRHFILQCQFIEIQNKIARICSISARLNRMCSNLLFQSNFFFRFGLILWGKNNTHRKKNRIIQEYFCFFVFIYVYFVFFFLLSSIPIKKIYIYNIATTNEMWQKQRHDRGRFEIPLTCKILKTKIFSSTPPDPQKQNENEFENEKKKRKKFHYKQNMK